MSGIFAGLLAGGNAGSYLDVNPQDYIAVAYNSSFGPPNRAAIYNYVTNTFVAGAEIPILNGYTPKHIIRFGNTIAVCYSTGIVYLYNSYGLLLTTYTLPNIGYADFNKVAPDKLLAITTTNSSPSLYSTMMTVANNSISLVEHVNLYSIFAGGPSYSSPAFAPAYFISDGLITSFRGKIILNSFYSYIDGYTVTLRGTVDYNTSTFLYSSQSLNTNGTNFSRPSAGSSGSIIYAGNMDGSNGEYYMMNGGASGSVSYGIGSTDMHPVHVQGTNALIRASTQGSTTLTAFFFGTGGIFGTENFGSIIANTGQIVSVKDGALIFASENTAQFTKLYKGAIFDSAFDFREQSLITAIPGWINLYADVRRVQFF